MIKFLTLLLIGISYSLFAEEFDDLHLSVGNLSRDIGHVQTSPQGSKSYFEFNPVFSAGAIHNFPYSLKMALDLGSTLPESRSDSNIKRWDYYLSLSGGYTLSFLSHYLGAGLYNTRIWSKGGSVRLDNGLGESDFFLPAIASSSRLPYLLTKLDFALPTNLSINSTLFVFHPLDKFKRSLSYIIAITYHFGTINLLE